MTQGCWQSLLLLLKFWIRVLDGKSSFNINLPMISILCKEHSSRSSWATRRHLRNFCKLPLKLTITNKQTFQPKKRTIHNNHNNIVRNTSDLGSLIHCSKLGSNLVRRIVGATIGQTTESNIIGKRYAGAWPYWWLKVAKTKALARVPCSGWNTKRVWCQASMPALLVLENKSYL